VEINRFFIKEKLDAGIIKIAHVSSEQQVADCFFLENAKKIFAFHFIEKVGVLHAS
jgi:hypothetical protein